MQLKADTDYCSVETSIVVQNYSNINMSHTASLWDILIHYYEHGYCSLFWVDPTHFRAVLKML